jgi:Family of unknown function (DUF6364)
MGQMNVTITLDDDLVKELRKIAAERETTLTGLIREYLQRVAAESSTSGRKSRERQSLERSFKQLRVRLGKRNWTRADLYARP